MKMKLLNIIRAFLYSMLAVVVLNGLLGCSVYQCYPGKSLPKNEVAYLQLGSLHENLNLRRWTCLESIDGNPIGKRLGKVAVLPGDHLYVFSCFYTGGGTIKTHGATIEVPHTTNYPLNAVQSARINVLPGRNYQIKYRLNNNWKKVKSFTVTDIDNDIVIFKNDY